MNGIFGTSKSLSNISIFIWVILVALVTPICFNANMLYLIAAIGLIILGINRTLLNKNILLICLYWILINILCSVFKPYSFNLNNVIGYLVPYAVSSSGSQSLNLEKVRRLVPAT